jgi:hypothetical protein
MTARVQLQNERDKERRKEIKKKETSGGDHGGAWRQDEPIGGKPPVVK